MTIRRGYMRDCLQRATVLNLPHGLYPYNLKWRFRRELHERKIASFIAKLRTLADDLEFALYGGHDDQK